MEQSEPIKALLYGNVGVRSKSEADVDDVMCLAREAVLGEAKTGDWNLIVIDNRLHPTCTEEEIRATGYTGKLIVIQTIDCSAKSPKQTEELFPGLKEYADKYGPNPTTSIADFIFTVTVP